MSPKDFDESRYLEKDWFETFTLGHDEPGVYNWLDEGEKKLGGNELDVEYFINEWRYRDKIIPAIEQSAAFGCSYTFGYGVNNPWPKLLGVANLGQNGASNDMIARLAITYCKTFKPADIYVMWTFNARREHVNETGGVEKFRTLSNDAIQEEIKSPTWLTNYAMLGSVANDSYNYDKNKLLLTSFCKANNVNLHQLNLSDFSKSEYPLARDNDHPGDDWHTNVIASF